MIYNPRITLHQIVFRREKKEGRYVSDSQPFNVPVEEIGPYTDGEVQLANGTTIYVEEFEQQITDLIEENLRSLEAYNAQQREIERIGMDPTQTEEV